MFYTSHRITIVIPDELNDYIQICKPKLIFFTNGCKETVMKLKESKDFIKNVIVTDSTFYQNVLNLVHSTSEDIVFPLERHNHDTALVLLSSGTTGRQKGVELTFENVLQCTIQFL